MPLVHTRAIVAAAVGGRLAEVPTRKEPYFQLEIPVSCPGVAEQVLDPRSTWPNPDDYDRKAAELVNRFQENERQLVESQDSRQPG